MRGSLSVMRTGTGNAGSLSPSRDEYIPDIAHIACLLLHIGSHLPLSTSTIASRTLLSFCLITRCALCLLDDRIS